MSGSGAYDGGMGVEGVCGTKGEDAICGDEMLQEDADDVCTGIGARLCTEEEYEALEAGNSGCKFEKKGYYAWTSTKCGNKNKGRMSIKLTAGGEATKLCKEKKEMAYGGRCCADMGEVIATEAPTLAPVATDPPVATDAPTPEVAPISEKTCAEMGWSDEIVNRPGQVGVLGVCGTKPDETVCGGEIAFSDADTICSDLGVRLCTEVEYEMLEAWDSGCKYEKKGRYVWTRTACTTDDSKPGRVTIKLATTGGATNECTADDAMAYGGRCCADVGELESVAPTMAPSVDPDAIDEIMAELMCIAASATKSECKAALPAIVGKCKWSKGGKVEDRCQLKVFYGSCDSLNKHDCVKAVSKGRCDFDDEEAKTCKDKEE